MKRMMFALSAAALIASAVLLPSTAASGGLIEAIDAGVDTTSLQADIPRGTHGLFSVTATLSGPTAATVNITDSVGGGTIDRAASSLAACAGDTGASLSVLTCRVSLSPDSPTATIVVAVRSSTDPAVQQVFNHAAVAMTGANDETLVGVDTNASNDQDSASTQITCSAATYCYVPEGGSITYEGDGQTHILTVVDAKGPGGGAVVTLSDPGEMNCGTEASPRLCNGVHIGFEEGHDGGHYEAAVQVDSSGRQEPCRGLGSGAGCLEIKWRKTASDPMVDEAPCGTEGPAEPCLSHVYKSEGGIIHYVSNMDTDDPDIGMPGVPTISGTA